MRAYNALKEGLVPEQNIDSAVTRLMLASFKLGMFDPVDAIPYLKITIKDNNRPAHSRLAKGVADESIVLSRTQTAPCR